MASGKRIDPSTLRAQFDALTAAYPEIAADEILRADMFEAETDLYDVMRQLEQKRQDVLGLIEGNERRMAELSQRRKDFFNRKDAIRSLMLKILQWADVKKIVLPEATLFQRNNPRRVIITDELAVPDKFCRFVRTPDLSKIYEAFDNFETVPGATLSNAEPSIVSKIASKKPSPDGERDVAP